MTNNFYAMIEPNHKRIYFPRMNYFVALLKVPKL